MKLPNLSVRFKWCIWCIPWERSVNDPGRSQFLSGNTLTHSWECATKTEKSAEVIVEVGRLWRTELKTLRLGKEEFMITDSDHVWNLIPTLKPDRETVSSSSQAQVEKTVKMTFQPNVLTSLRAHNFMRNWNGKNEINRNRIIRYLRRVNWTWRALRD